MSEKRRVDILSLSPGFFSGPFEEGLMKKAQEKGLIEIRLVNIRDWAEGNYRQVDDRPYGGGPGMVLMAEPILKAIRACKTDRSRVVYLSPQGTTLTAGKCRELAKEEHLILLCGHYEGIDARVLESGEIDEEISIGDYVLMSGCPAAVVLVDAVSRFIPGVLGHPLSAENDSFEENQLEYPHYTRPQVFEGKSVPDVLLNGDHQKIEDWRKEQAIKKTQHMRPDMLNK